MEKDTEKIDIISEGHLYFLRNISLDNVIFSYQKEELKVLLQNNPLVNRWAITGGFINRAETLAEAALRIAGNPTGLQKVFTKQFRAFGGPERLRADLHSPRIRSSNIPDDSWLNDYFVTIGYYSLIEFDKVKLDNAGREYRWWNAFELPTLMMDHNNIIENAISNLKEDINHRPLAKELLPGKFTLPELHALYETIQGKTLDRANFYKKIKSLGWLIKLYERKKIGAHKSPYLHMFDPEL